MRMLFSILPILFASLHLCAQTWTYAGSAGSTVADGGRAICVDAGGNVYVTGFFTNTVDFDLGAGVANLTSLGSQDIFIASYTSVGVYRWAVRAGSTGNDNTNTNGGICTDGVSVYVTGNYIGTGTPTAFGSINLTPNGGNNLDVFAAKLNATTGAWIWAVSIGGSGSAASENGMGICLDPSGNPYLLGTFIQTTSGACINVSLGGSDIFVRKLNPTNGACVWMSSGGTGVNDGGIGGGICYHPGTASLVVVTTTNVGLGTFGTFSSNTAGANDLWVLELDASTGDWLGAVSAGAGFNDDAVACAYDPITTNVMVCGAFSNNLTLPGGISLTNSGSTVTDAWWGSYSVTTNGFVWARSAVGTLADRANGITVDGLGSALITGQYLTNPTTFGGLPLTNTSNHTLPDDMFVVNFSTSTGAVNWVTKNTNSGTQGASTIGRAITYAGNNTYWVTGQNANGATFNLTLPSNGFADMFIARIGTPAPLPVELSSFTIDCEDELEQLNWTSESEYRFDYYEIEKSYDLNDFTSIGIVDVDGESTTTLHYSFDLPSTDENTSVYYRLKMVDQDGTVEYSDIISGISCNPEDDQQLLKSYSYDGGKLTLQLFEPGAKVELFTITGQHIVSPEETIEHFRTIQLNTNGQHVYLLRITAADGSKTSVERIFF